MYKDLLSEDLVVSVDKGSRHVVVKCSDICVVLLNE